jgi:hypothetical protein
MLWGLMGDSTFQRPSQLVAGQPWALSGPDALPLSPLLLTQRALNRLHQPLLPVLGLIDISRVVKLRELHIDLHHVLQHSTPIPVVPVLVREVVDPSLAVGPHNLEHIDGQTVVACILKQGGNGVLDAHDLVAEGVHAHFVGELQGLAEVLVRLANVEPLAAAVEQGFAQLFGHGLGEVVVRLGDDGPVVPGNVEEADARHDYDAGVGVLGLPGCIDGVGRSHSNRKGEQYGALAVLLPKLLTQGGAVAPSYLLLNGSP